MNEAITLLRGKKSVWLLTAALILGIGLVLLGSVGERDAVSVPGEDPGPRWESQVKELCDRVTGTSDSCVMLTLDSYGETVYAADREQRESGEITEESVNHVSVGNSRELIPAMQMAPRVRGAAVICRGGDDPALQLKLTGMLCALFDIPASAVSILGYR